MKKRTIVLVAAIALVALAVPTLAFAAGFHGLAPTPTASNAPAAAPAAHEVPATSAPALMDEVAAAVNRVETTPVATPCAGYVDADGNGVCDTCGNAAGTCPGYVDVDNNGVCDNRTEGTCPQGGCAGWVDTNGDGACDTCGSTNGSCPGYVDANGDGVCDSFGNGTCPRHGHSNGQGNGTYGYGNGQGRGHHGGGHGGCWNR